MTPEEALKILDETVIGNLELKIVMSKALKKQIPKKPIKDAEKLKVIDAIVSKSYETLPLISQKDKGAFYDGIMSSIFAVLVMKDESEVEEE